MARPELASAGTSVSRCITAATLRSMDVASVRDLRNHGGEILDRVEAGARVTVTRDGRPVEDLQFKTDDRVRTVGYTLEVPR